jgi:transcriptional regulator with XRE-family HTH domain
MTGELINPQELRGRLIKILKLNPMTMNMLAKKIGISSITLDKFLNNVVTPNLMTLIMIENFVEKEEESRK